MERGKSHLCNQRLSTPVPAHIQSDGLVRGVAVCGDSLWELPPFNMIDGAFLKYFGIPVAFTWFVSQKTFDGKKAFWIPKILCELFPPTKSDLCRKSYQLKNQKFNTSVTAVRSVMYVPIKYIENNLVFNHDGECFAYYELTPYNYSFLSPEEKYMVHDNFRQLIARTVTEKSCPTDCHRGQPACSTGAFQKGNHRQIKRDCL